MRKVRGVYIMLESFYTTILLSLLTNATVKTSSLTNSTPIKEILFRTLEMVSLVIHDDSRNLEKWEKSFLGDSSRFKFDLMYYLLY